MCGRVAVVLPGVHVGVDLVDRVLSAVPSLQFIAPFENHTPTTNMLRIVRELQLHQLWKMWLKFSAQQGDVDEFLSPRLSFRPSRRRLESRPICSDVPGSIESLNFSRIIL